jgi:hypothetical protein
MACACKTDATMSYLQKKYGGNIPTNKPSNIREEFKAFGKRAVGVLFAIPLLPVFAVSALTRKKKPISISKVFNIKRG